MLGFQDKDMNNLKNGSKTNKEIFKNSQKILKKLNKICKLKNKQIMYLFIEPPKNVKFQN